MRIHDNRTEDERRRTTGYVIAIDVFLSGWGAAAAGKSIYALAILDGDDAQARIVAENIGARTEMRDIRFVRKIPHGKTGDHLSIAGPTYAGTYYINGGIHA